MPNSYFLKLGLSRGSGITGGSSNKSFPGWIEIDSWGPVLPASAGSVGPGKIRVQEYAFAKRPDVASPVMFQASHTGRYFDGAVLAIEGLAAPAGIEFKDLNISGFRHDLPLESFTINFASMKFTGAMDSSHPAALGRRL